MLCGINNTIERFEKNFKQNKINIKHKICKKIFFFIKIKKIKSKMYSMA